MEAEYSPPRFYAVAPERTMPQAARTNAPVNQRHDWSLEEVEALFDTPFMELMWQAQQVHRQHFNPNVIQASSLLNIKTGGCAENCGYCSQSAHHEKEVKLSRDALMDRVKGEPLEAFDRSIDVHVSRIRQALEDDPKHPRRILTVRGAGYVFARAQD